MDSSGTQFLPPDSCFMLSQFPDIIRRGGKRRVNSEHTPSRESCCRAKTRFRFTRLFALAIFFGSFDVKQISLMVFLLVEKLTQRLSIEDALRRPFILRALRIENCDDDKSH